MTGIQVRNSMASKKHNQKNPIDLFSFDKKNPMKYPIPEIEPIIETITVTDVK